MNLQIKKIVSTSKSLSIYFSASLIPMMLSLLINPLVSLNMSPDDFAISGFYTAFNTLFTPFVTFYFTHYYTKRYFELEENQRQILKSTIFKSLISFSFFLSVIALLGLFLYMNFFNNSTDITFFPFAVISIFSIPFIGIYNLNLIEYRMQRKSVQFFKLSVTNGTLLTIITLLLVVLLKLGALGKLMSVFSASLIMFSFCFYLNKSLLKYSFNWNYFKGAVLFCFPLVLAAMLSFFTLGFDKVYLERIVDNASLGYYVVGASIAGYINIFTNSINDTFQPDIFQSIAKHNYLKCCKIVIVKLILILFIVSLFILLAPILIKLLTANKYIDSTIYARIISLSCISGILFQSISQITIAKGFTTLTLTNKIIGSVGCVICYIFLISQYGTIGAAWACVLSYLIFFIGNVILLLIKYSRQVHHG